MIRVSTVNIKARVTIVVLLIAVFCVLAAIVTGGGASDLETGVYDWVSRFISDGWTGVMTVITQIGSRNAIVAVMLLLIVLPFTRKTLGIPVVSATLISAALNEGLKLLFARERPDILWLIEETGYGFPSGHAMNSMALFGTIILATFQWTQRPAVRVPVLVFGVLLPLMIGISRVYLGVHNAGDVLAGWTLGAAVAVGVDTAKYFSTSP